MKLNLKLGCDPELFVREKASGRFISAHTLLPGTKERPHPVRDGAVQVDGVAAEFNIVPAASPSEWCAYIDNVLLQMKDMLGPDYLLEIVPVVVFDYEYFKSLPEEVRQLGCNMDYDAWTGQPNDPPDGNSTTMRTAAGHIHIGWTNGEDPRDPDHIRDCCEVAKQLDYYLGIPSIIWDKDERRRLLYGKAGAFRPKTYGLEYRTLSNKWLANAKLKTYVYYAAKSAILSMLNSNLRMAAVFGAEARRIINNEDYEFVMSDEFRNKIWSKTDMTWPKW